MFNQDLRDGKKYEHKVCSYINRKYPLACVVDGENKEGDIYIPETDSWIEVKHDRLVGKTGNFFVEISYNGEPSGIKTSQSEWWAICDDEFAHVLPLEEIRFLTRRLKPIKVPISGNNMVGYLIPADKIRFGPYTKTWLLPH